MWFFYTLHFVCLPKNIKKLIGGSKLSNFSYTCYVFVYSICYPWIIATTWAFIQLLFLESAPINIKSKSSLLIITSYLWRAHWKSQYMKRLPPLNIVIIIIVIIIILLLWQLLLLVFTCDYFWVMGHSLKAIFHEMHL